MHEYMETQGNREKWVKTFECRNNTDSHFFFFFFLWFKWWNDVSFCLAFRHKPRETIILEMWMYFKVVLLGLSTFFFFSPHNLQRRVKIASLDFLFQQQFQWRQSSPRLWAYLEGHVSKKTMPETPDGRKKKKKGSTTQSCTHHSGELELEETEGAEEAGVPKTEWSWARVKAPLSYLSRPCDVTWRRRGGSGDTPERL